VALDHQKQESDVNITVSSFFWSCNGGKMPQSAQKN